VSRWVNSPWQLREAENKLTQLAAAEQAGLTIPATLVTNQVEQLRRFAETCSTGVVHKSLSSPVVSLHDGVGQFLYTAPIASDEIGCLPFPCLFQQRLLPRTEYRVTVIGRRTFTASLDRAAHHQPDWRRAADDHRRFAHHQLDDELISAIRDLMATLGIQVGAVDLIETTDQTYFLEINPSAALTWLERALGMHLCQTVTNLILCGA
jgi:glutathione synthase/RimK-type ligase-like ATP-grasp enzyme